MSAHDCISGSLSRPKGPGAATLAGLDPAGECPLLAVVSHFLAFDCNGGCVAVV